jgi:hypothetical protein
MPTTPIAYNTGSSIGGTIQVGNLAVGTSSQDYSSNPGGVKWWMGPEDSTGFVIAIPVSGNDQPTPIIFEPSASIGFYRSLDLTDNSFISLSNAVFNQNFTNASSASAWLTSNGYWNTYSASAASSAFTVTVTQVGPNVVWSGTGSFDLTGLTLSGSLFGNAGFNANLAIWAIGPQASSSVYTGIDSGFPANFGNNGIGVSSTVGSTFGILNTSVGNNRTLVVPLGYTSNTLISGSATYNNITIADFLYTGSYVWTWNSGSNSLTMNIG